MEKQPKQKKVVVKKEKVVVKKEKAPMKKEEVVLEVVHDVDVAGAKKPKVKREKKERTAEQVEADKKKMAALRALKGKKKD